MYICLKCKRLSRQGEESGYLRECELPENLLTTVTSPAPVYSSLCYRRRAVPVIRRPLPLSLPSVLHASDLLLVGVLLEARVEVLPPLEEHRFADQLEPRRKLELGVGKESLELLGRDVFRVLDFVQVGVEVDIGLDEQDIVNCESAWLANTRPPRQNTEWPYSRALPTCHRWGPCSECE